MFRRSRGLARGNVFLHRLRVAYARSLTFAGLGTGTGFFQLRINANLRELFLGCGNAGTRENFSRRSRRLCKFFGRSGILPLHFCYFSPQTPSAESATEHGNTGTRERREREFSHADSADCTDFMGGCASRVSNFIFTLQTLLCRRH